MGTASLAEDGQQVYSAKVFHLIKGFILGLVAKLIAERY